MVNESRLVCRSWFIVFLSAFLTRPITEELLYTDAEEVGMQSTRQMNLKISDTQSASPLAFMNLKSSLGGFRWKSRIVQITISSFFSTEQ